MQFRRNGLRDERRRRALMEDRTGGVVERRDGAETVVSSIVPSRTYSKSAVDERRVRIVDAVPIYAIHVASLYGVFALLAVGLLALHHYVGSLIRWADLGRVDSLGTWFASGGLFVGALTACLIFRIRRHRLDDYRGRYRCWLWFTGLLLFASLDTILNFRSDVAMGLESLTQMRLLGRTDAWWALVWSVAFGAMGVRAALEVRESRGTLVVGALAGASLAVALGLQLDLLLLPPQLSAELTVHAARLGGLALLMAALVQYARYVWLDAQGLIAREVPTASDAAAAESTETKKPRTGTAAKNPTAKKEKRRASEEEESQDSETPQPRGWFSFGRKKNVEDTIVEEGGEDSAKVAPKPQRTDRTTARKIAAKADSENTTQETVEPKRNWFSFGWKKQVETEDTQPDTDTAKPAPAKTAKVTRPAARKEATDSDRDNKEDDAAPTKRSWFSFGSKKTKEEAIAEETAAPAKSKKTTAKPSNDEDEATEQLVRKSWFGWGKKAAEEEAIEDDHSPRKTMTPRITTRPKAATPPPAATTPPTITGKYSTQDDDSGDDSGESDEEILRLEAKPEHLLSKAERRRLKKLKRRAA